MSPAAPTSTTGAGSVNQEALIREITERVVAELAKR
jgi:hypothetical protein